MLIQKTSRKRGGPCARFRAMTVSILPHLSHFGILGGFCQSKNLFVEIVEIVQNLVHWQDNIAKLILGAKTC